MSARVGLRQDDRPALDALGRSIAMLSAAHGFRDPFTVRHQQRTAALCVAIGTRLGITPTRLEVLRLAASVHDAGKLALPTEILSRPDALSDPEYALIKTHCQIGFEILGILQAPFPVAEIAFQHHERLDGSGYPRGLRGAQILPEARVLGVADVYDAMTSKRPYRDGLPRDFVLGDMQRKAGRSLDADAVEACRLCTQDTDAVGGHS